jgi:hypothetical protein
MMLKRSSHILILLLELVCSAVKADQNEAGDAMPAFPAAENETSCYDNSTELLLALTNKDPFAAETYIVCPNSKFQVGMMTGEEGSDVYCCVDGDSPLVPRQNSRILCGEDGSSANNCVWEGGMFQLLNVFAILGEQGENMFISGMTFRGSATAGAMLSNGGDLTLKDCIFEEHNNLAPILSYWTPETVTGRRRLELDLLSDMPVLNRIGYVMKEYELLGRSKIDLGQPSSSSSSLFDSSVDVEEETVVAYLNNDRRLEETVVGLRQHVVFDGCTFRNNSLGDLGGEEKYGIVSVELPYDDLELNECLFTDNHYGDPEDQRGYFIQYLVPGSTLKLTNNCFLDNDMQGPGGIILQDEADLLANTNNYADADEDFGFCFIAIFADDVTATSNCMASDATECGILGVDEPVEPSSAAPTTKPGEPSTATPSTKPGEPSTAAPSTKPGEPSTAAPSAQPAEPSTTAPSTKPTEPSTAAPSTKPGEPSTAAPSGVPSASPSGIPSASFSHDPPVALLCLGVGLVKVWFEL